MTGKIFGIPLALIILALLIALMVNVPMFLFHQETVRRLEVLDVKINNINQTVNREPVPVITPEIKEVVTPTATPEATRKVPTPTDTE